MARIRLATTADADALAAIYRPVVEGTTISFETVPPDADEMARRIRETTARLPWLVCEREGQTGTEVAGYAYAGPFDDREAYRWSVTTSVYVAEPHRRRGVARGLYRSLFACLRYLGLVNAYAVVTVPNPPSVGFHESMGFERVGRFEDVGFKLGAWRDVGYWHYRLREPRADPDPPVTVHDCRGEDGWEVTLHVGESSVVTAE